MEPRHSCARTQLKMMTSFSLPWKWKKKSNSVLHILEELYRVELRSNFNGRRVSTNLKAIHSVDLNRSTSCRKIPAKHGQQGFYKMDKHKQMPLVES